MPGPSIFSLQSNTMNRESTPFDDPWRRLPWLALMALLFWGGSMYAFAHFLGHTSAAPDVLAPLDAELTEERVPPKPVQVPKQPPPRPMHETKPAAPTLPRPSQAQPVPETPPPPGPPAETPASSTPLTLPGTSLPSGSATSRDSGMPAFETRPSTAPYSSAGTGPATTPPQFGAAYLNNPRPAYPPAARKMGMQGLVMLKVLVSRSGNVREIEVAQSSGYDLLDRTALEAVKGWHFVPARRGDSAVDEWVQVPVAFHLNK
jgi:periplasmic protein TonB